MNLTKERQIIKREIESLNEEINNLEQRLCELLNVNCSFGECILDSEVTDVQKRIREAHDTKELLERLSKNSDSSLPNENIEAMKVNKK